MIKDPSLIIEVTNASIGYHSGSRHNVLFRELNLKVHAGDFICFMGPNGIGKSTLIRGLAGLHHPDSGTITHREPHKSQSEQVSVVLTDKISGQNMTVYEMVSFGRYPYLDWTIRFRPEDKRRIDEAIEQVKIQHLTHQKLSELSDGQMQLVMIARALAQDTPLMLLDEPTAHLDLNNRIEIMKLLRALAHQTGKAIIVSSHDLDLALQTADLIWLAGRNQNIITGLPEDLVLNGVFDDIFRFKGFDLKTGKVQHQVSQEKQIQLSGEGHAFLWTKNALERSGYEVVMKGDYHINIRPASVGSVWMIGDRTFTSLAQVISFLKENT